MLEDIIEDMEDLRIDVEAETAYCDQTGELMRRYERANEMLDECIEIVRRNIKQQ